MKKKRYSQTHTHTQTEILLSCKEEGNTAISSNIDVPWGYYAKKNKSDRERQIHYYLTYMWDLKKLNSTETE